MAVNIRRLVVLVALTAVLLLGAALLALSYIEVGLTSSIPVGWVATTMPDMSTVPQSVADDAAELAQELYGDYEDKYEEFIDQLLASYVEAKDKDFVVIFNPGGWGWNVLDSSPGWQSITNGIKSELDNSGYDSLLLHYRRTEANLRSVMAEFVGVLTDYPTKTENLAKRVEFLTSHIPDLKVIITGESNGGVITDTVMSSLRDNQRVYSIQTGTPFWHDSFTVDRTLVLRDNGIRPDSFSQGDISTMLGASLKASLGLESPEEVSPGKILYFIRAPGHDYGWQYPNVNSEIRSFLRQKFGLKQG